MNNKPCNPTVTVSILLITKISILSKVRFPKQYKKDTEPGNGAGYLA